MADHSKKTELACVQSLLRPSELCFIAFNTREWMKNGRCVNVILAVVTNTVSKPDESAIFTLFCRDGNWDIRDVIPITSDITFRFVTPVPGNQTASTSNAAGSVASKIQVPYFELKAPLSARQQKLIVGGIDAMGGGSSEALCSEYLYETANQQTATTFRAAVMKAFSVAKDAKFTVNGTSHEWSNYYTLLRGARMAYEAGAATANRPPQRRGATGKKGGDVVAFNASEMTMAWIAKTLATREAEFTTQKTMMLFTGTWNVNGQEPPASLEHWLVNPSSKPDIYCIGFQELDLSASALVLRNMSQSPPWQLAIQTALRTVGDYVLLQKKQLVGILLFVYVKREHLPKISDVAIDEAAVGIMGVMGNKGGVAVRFNICDSSFCIVNSHLNAHMANVPRRNQDYNDISKRLFLNGGQSGGYTGGIVSTDSFASQSGEEGEAAAVVSSGTGQPAVTSIFDHDFLFWMGDLNYRIEGPDAEVRQKIQQGDYLALLAQDQLKAQMRQGLAFEHFQEHQIRFAPTYKYDKDSNVYDSSGKARTPAWCDRVLWRARDPESVTPLHYGRHELLSSDHRPVSAEFLLKVKSIIPDRRAQVYQELLKQLDTMENETMPDVQISESVVDFGKVGYRRSVSRTVTLKNPGMVLARWLFIPKLEETSVHKPWLTVSPYSGIMFPQETTQITITVFVDKEAASALNSGTDKLDDVLILHVNNGKDIFLTLTGEYQRSCFSMPLELLTRYPGPVRSSDPLPVDSSPESRLAIPKELWRIVDYIYRFGMEEPNIFGQSGSSDMVQIRECLDTGESFSTHDFNIHSMAETLVSFLASLCDSVIPSALYHHALEASSSFAACRQLVSTQLSAAHYNTFYYVTSFLREIVTFSASNKLTVDRLAVLFSRVLLRPPSSAPPKNPEVTARKAADFVRHFLVDEK